MTSDECDDLKLAEAVVSRAINEAGETKEKLVVLSLHEAKGVHRVLLLAIIEAQRAKLQ